MTHTCLGHVLYIYRHCTYTAVLKLYHSSMLVLCAGWFSTCCHGVTYTFYTYGMLPPKNRQYLHVPPCTLLTYHIITLYGHVLSPRYRHPGGAGGVASGICTCISEGRTLQPFKGHTGLERKTGTLIHGLGTCMIILIVFSHWRWAKRLLLLSRCAGLLCANVYVHVRCI